MGSDLYVCWAICHKSSCVEMDDHKRVAYVIYPDIPCNWFHRRLMPKRCMVSKYGPRTQNPKIISESRLQPNSKPSISFSVDISKYTSKKTCAIDLHPSNQALNPFCWLQTASYSISYFNPRSTYDNRSSPNDTPPPIW